MAITADKLFVTNEMFVKWSPINGTVDWNLIVPHMLTAQDQYLGRYLGDALYEKLKTDFNAWSGNYLTLVDNYVRKVVMCWTLKECLPNLRVKIQNGTLTIYSGEDFESATEQDMKRLVDQATKNAQWYTQKMVDYLCYNGSLFTEYGTASGTQRHPSHRVYGGFEIDFSRGGRSNAVHYQDYDSIFNFRWH